MRNLVMKNPLFLSTINYKIITIVVLKKYYNKTNLNFIVQIEY